MSKEKGELIPVTDSAQIPEKMNEDEARKFWETHEMTEEFYEKAGPPPEGVLPSASLPGSARRRKG